MFELCKLKSPMKLNSYFLFFFIILFFLKFSIAVDTLTTDQNLTDTGQTLISLGGNFELGFFSPWNSENRYVGIWFKNVPEQTVVWVANRDNPLNSSGVLRITISGTLQIFDNRSENLIWSSDSSMATSNNPVLQLLDNGNLVVNDGGSGFNYIWQSFDHPCDTLIPGMKLGFNLETNQSWSLNSWKSLQDPSTGDYTYKLDTSGLSQALLVRQGIGVTYRSGSWDGSRFGGGPPLRKNAVFQPIFIVENQLFYYTFVNNENTTISRFVVNQSAGGLVKQLTWNPRQRRWADIITLQDDQCDKYNHCGPNGICNSNMVPNCRCPKGFRPKIVQDWDALDFSGGCIRITPLNCTSYVKFKKYSGLKLPDSSQFLVNKTASNQLDCEAACWTNCSCTAYAETEFSGCVLWFGDLHDMREYSEGGKVLYIKVDSSVRDENSSTKRRLMIIILTSSVFGLSLFISVILCLHWVKKSKRIEEDRPFNYNEDGDPTERDEDMDQLPLFDYAIILTATNHFAFQNKIGQGGFGNVYKGELPSGQQIAVKRLSKDSGQGLKEFKNEVIFISKLQHRNLVRLLGCCIYGDEQMLVYEYLPNKSLDTSLFNQTRETSLPWDTRFNIIIGVARGLLYLHRDSRLRIIHRDLKASNILLDNEMNPKISDFGLARSFGGDLNEVNTSRVMGTYGYMSPEYAVDGLFSVKSDVFSFGVLVLEIINGKKNRGFYHPDHDLNLLGHAWRLWIEDRTLELKDNLMEEPINTSEMLKCVQVGLLCVQQRPEDRPEMSAVVFMLDCENPDLSEPKQPGFYTERFLTGSESTSNGNVRTIQSKNEVTCTIIQGR